MHIIITPQLKWGFEVDIYIRVIFSTTGFLVADYDFCCLEGFLKVRPSYLNSNNKNRKEL